MKKSQIKTGAFFVASAAILIVAFKGGAAKAIAVAAFALLSALVGVDPNIFSGG